MSIKYCIELAPAAERQLKKLAPRVKENIRKHIEKLSTEPCPINAKKLSGIDNLYRIRVGDYRVVYTINDSVLLILIVRIGDRKEIYRSLRNLKSPH